MRLALSVQAAAAVAPERSVRSAVPVKLTVPVASEASAVRADRPALAAREALDVVQAVAAVRVVPAPGDQVARAAWVDRVAPAVRAARAARKASANQHHRRTGPLLFRRGPVLCLTHFRPGPAAQCAATQRTSSRVAVCRTLAAAGRLTARAS